MNIPERYWEIKTEDLFKLLETSFSGLSQAEAENRLTIFGHNILKKKRKKSALSLFISQFKSPIILILIFASAVSAVARDFTDTAIILLLL